MNESRDRQALRHLTTLAANVCSADSGIGVINRLAELRPVIPEARAALAQPDPVPDLTRKVADLSRRLIAAEDAALPVPELVEALRDLMSLYEASPGRDPNFIAKARAALAKVAP